MANQIARDHAQLAADRELLARALHEVEQKRYMLDKRTRELNQTLDSLAMRNTALDTREISLMERREAQEMDLAALRESLEISLVAQKEALDNREASLRVLETALIAQREELESERKKPRRRDTAPSPVLPTSGPQHLHPDPRAAKTPQQYMQCLTAFKVWSGNRSLRQISELSGGRISASGVRNILNGSVLPDRLEVVDAIVQGCGGTDEDRKAFASAWRRLYMGSTEITLIDIDHTPRS